MAKMGSSRHLKRLAAPAFWPIARKEFKWVVKPSPGPHPIERSLPLLVVVRDVLGLAETAREAKRIISDGKIFIDGRVRRDYKFPVGLMDVIYIPEIDKSYRMVPHPVKVLWPVEIPLEERDLKLVRIDGKRTVKGGNIQLNLHDGRNIVIRTSRPIKPPEDAYKPMDSLLIKVPTQEIINHFKLSAGSLVVVIDGKNVGRVGRIVNITKGMGYKRTVVTIEDETGSRFNTILSYVMVVGGEKPVITVTAR